MDHITTLSAIRVVCSLWNIGLPAPLLSVNNSSFNNVNNPSIYTWSHAE